MDFGIENSTFCFNLLICLIHIISIFKAFNLAWNAQKFISVFYISIDVSFIVQIFWTGGNGQDYLVVRLILCFVLLLVLNCGSRIREDDKQICPEQNASIFSQIFYLWFWKYLRQVYFSQKLKLEDLWKIRVQDSSAYLSQVTGKKFGQGDKKVRILYDLINCFQIPIIFAGVLKILEQVLIFAGPYVANLIIGYKGEDTESESLFNNGYFFVTLLLIVSTIKIIISNQYLYRTSEIGMRVRSLLCNRINSKLLRLSSESLTDLNMGELVNMTIMDAQSIGFFCSYLHVLWGVPAQIILSLYFQWKQLGLPVLAGFLTLIFLMVLDLKLAKRSRNLFQAELKTKDERIKATNEVLSKIKEIKMSAFEPIYENWILGHRSKELKFIRQSSYIRASSDFIWSIAPVIVSLVTFATYLYWNQENSLGPNQVFVYLMLFQIMEPPLKSIPGVVQGILQAKVGVDRIQKLLEANEIDRNSLELMSNNKMNSIMLTNASFSWKTQPKVIPVIQNCNLEFEVGKLIGIAGPVGSGKTSFISALLGQMQKISGSVHIISTDKLFSYVPQTPWILGKTLKENIIMDLTFDTQKFSNIIHACELEKDIDQMPEGWETMIGESGSSLSGGQKQRISLARALYHDGSIYIVDNIMVAFDPKVCKNIFNRVFGSDGLLQRKTRFLVTNNLELLKRMDEIVLVENQTVSKVKFQSLDLLGLGSENGTIRMEVEPESAKETSSLTKASKVSSGTPVFKDKRKPVKFTDNQSIPEVHLNNWSLFQKYIQYIGLGASLAIITFYVLCQSFMTSSNMWLSKWTANTKSSPESSFQDLMIYLAIGIAQGLTSFLALSTLEWGTLRASFAIHKMMIQKILLVPLSYFTTVSSGEIINNFSKDLEVVDKSMSRVLMAYIKGILALSTTIVLASLANPIFIISTTIPLGICCVIVQRFSASGLRELCNIDAATNSVLFSQLKTTLQGISSIQAHRMDTKVETEFYEKMDDNIVCVHAANIAHRFMAVCLEFIAMIFLGLIGFSGIYYIDSMSPGMIGLLLTNGFQVTSSINFLVIVTCSFETQLSSVVRRLLTYFQLPVEQVGDKKTFQDPKFPSGNITFEKYSGRYEKHLEPVLSDITTKIGSGEKIGIVGRTGAGKSSIFLALLRLLDPESETGQIRIDNQDISSLHSNKLRQGITVIPQDPLILSGSIRMNLDPWNTHTEPEIWKVLSKTELKDFVESLPQCLDYEISNEKDKFSMGQRILISFGRAILNKSKIILLDETLSCVDDNQVQGTLERILESEFKSSTILTITHNFKLNSLLNFSRIMVIDDGKLVEMESPESLIKNPGSFLNNTFLQGSQTK